VAVRAELSCSSTSSVAALPHPPSIVKTKLQRLRARWDLLKAFVPVRLCVVHAACARSTYELVKCTCPACRSRQLGQHTLSVPHTHRARELGDLHGQSTNFAHGIKVKRVVASARRNVVTKRDEGQEGSSSSNAHHVHAKMARAQGRSRQEGQEDKAGGCGCCACDCATAESKCSCQGCGCRVVELAGSEEGTTKGCVRVLRACGHDVIAMPSVRCRQLRTHMIAMQCSAAR
jgi:hypothetical protein